MHGAFVCVCWGGGGGGISQLVSLGDKQPEQKKIVPIEKPY